MKAVLEKITPRSEQSFVVFSDSARRDVTFDDHPARGTPMAHRVNEILVARTVDHGNNHVPDFFAQDAGSDIDAILNEAMVGFEGSESASVSSSGAGAY